MSNPVFDLIYRKATGNSDEKVSDSVREVRLNRCMNCPRLIKPTNNCGECGCFVSLKTQYRAESCPLGKW